MTYIKLKDSMFNGIVSGKISDKEWNGRESKSITIESDFDTVNTLFQNDTSWSIVCEETIPVHNEDGTPVLDSEGNQTSETHQVEFDNSEYSIRGDLIVHTNGTCTVKMGKSTDLEFAYEALYGGM